MTTEQARDGEPVEPRPPVFEARPNPRMRRQDWLLFGLIFLLGIALRGVRFDFPQSVFFDEKYYQSAANDYLANRDDDNSVHPPLAKMHIAAAMLVFDALKAYGYHNLPDTMGWRLASLLSGIAVLLLSFRLALTVTRSRPVAHLTMFLVAIDFLQIVESRITMLDEIQAAWILLGFVWCADYRFRERRSLHLWGAGLAFGCATACKWNGLFAALGGFLSVLAACPPSRRWLHPLKVGLIFALTIFTVYLSSYTPFLMREGGLNKKSIKRIIGFHQRMLKFRYDPNQFKHKYISQFYEWPLVLRPIWYYYDEAKETPNSKEVSVRGIVAFGNVVFWWPAFFLLLEGLYYGVRYRDSATNFTSCGFFSQWILWASSTTGGFIYYMLPATPFMALALARHLQQWNRDVNTRPLVALYVLALVAATVVYYPLLVGLPVSQSYFHRTFFIGRWI